MYRLGYRVYSGWRHKRAFYVSVAVAMVMIGLILWYLKDQNRALIINPTTPITSSVKAPKPTIKTFAETYFALELPNSWKLEQHQTSPYNMYYFRNTTKYEDARYMYVYVDTIPASYAVNKLLPITVMGNHLNVGVLSDTCSNFTGPVSSNPDRPVAESNQPSKWEDVSFICDLSSYNRNIVGTGSLAGVNKFVLSGPKTGQHSFFFVYTDHTAEPEYQTLIDALESLKVN